MGSSLDSTIDGDYLCAMSTSRKSSPLRKPAARRQPAARQQQPNRRPAQELIRWEVRRITGTPAKFVDSVMAPDADSAVAKAIEEYGITDPTKQRKLVARRAGF